MDRLAHREIEVDSGKGAEEAAIEFLHRYLEIREAEQVMLKEA